MNTPQKTTLHLFPGLMTKSELVQAQNQEYCLLDIWTCWVPSIHTAMTSWEKQHRYTWYCTSFCHMVFYYRKHKVAPDRSRQATIVEVVVVGGGWCSKSSKLTFARYKDKTTNWRSIIVRWEKNTDASEFWENVQNWSQNLPKVPDGGGGTTQVWFG